MTHGFGLAAWREAHRRLLAPRAARPDTTHGRTYERAARAALRTYAGSVARSSVNPNNPESR